eukprot:1926505-Pyramimonas_sp.AAC.1
MGARAGEVAAGRRQAAAAQLGRVHQIRRVRKEAAVKLVNAGLKPATSYGISCMAWSSSALARWRSKLAA